MRTEAEVRDLINQAAKHCYVNPKLVNEHLLDNIDKKEITDGIIDKRHLILAIIAWRENGCPDYCGNGIH